MVHEIKMASEDGAGRAVTEELTQIVRECVRNEIALQRSILVEVERKCALLNINISC